MNWVLDNEVLSPSQKGFMPYDGSFENNFMLQSLLNEARTKKTELCFASIDISNTFGSIPHQAVLKALSASGAGDKIVLIATALLENTSTLLSTAAGTFESHPIKKGVRQGDAISGIFFNLAIDPILKRLENSAPKSPCVRK